MIAVVKMNKAGSAIVFKEVNGGNGMWVMIMEIHSWC